MAIRVSFLYNNEQKFKNERFKSRRVIDHSFGLLFVDNSQAVGDECRSSGARPKKAPIDVNRSQSSTGNVFADK